MLSNLEDLKRLLTDLKIPIVISSETDEITLKEIDSYMESKWKVRLIIIKSVDDPNRWMYLVSDDNPDTNSLVSEDLNDYETAVLARLVGTLEALSYVHLFLAENALLKHRNP